MTTTLTTNDIYPRGPWDRDGGQSFEVFASEEDLDRWLQELPDPWGPYELCGYDLVDAGDGRFVPVPFACPALRIASCRGGPEQRWNFWIRVSSVAPPLDSLAGERLSALLSFSGFINVQHGRGSGDREEPSAIALVDRLVNRSTGEVRAHDTQLRVYRHLVRRAKADIVCKSVWELADGTEREDRLVGFTRRAVELWRGGHRFAARPALGS